MHTAGIAAVALAILAIAACNPFTRQPDVRTASGTVARRNATLATPAELLGPARLGGTGLMEPGDRLGTTRIAVDVTNALPGALYPWKVHRGHCGSNQGIFGPAETYVPLAVDDGGRASASVTVPLVMPRDGRYHVRIAASASNPTTIVACGNLLPPAR